jgi:hypothetical protein
LAGTPYRRGSRSIEVVWNGETILDLHETNGVPLALFDGRTLHVNVQVRNAGKSPLRFLASTFGCAAE